MKKNNATAKLAIAALIGAVYAALTYMVYPVAFNVFQFRLSEALTVVPYLFPPASLGLFVGCAIANLGSPYGWVDIVFGSLATLIAALITSKIRIKWLAPLPSVIVNALIISLVITAQAPDAGLALFLSSAAYIGLEQAAVCYALGLPLLLLLEKFGLFEKYYPRIRSKAGE